MVLFHLFVIVMGIVRHLEAETFALSVVDEAEATCSGSDKIILKLNICHYHHSHHSNSETK